MREYPERLIEKIVLFIFLLCASWMCGECVDILRGFLESGIFLLL